MTTLTFGLGKSRETISANAIVMLEGNGTYSIVHLEKRKIHSAKCLKHWQSLLPEHFLRVHRKYLINGRYVIRHTEDSVTMASGLVIKCSRRRKAVLLNQSKQ